MEIHDREDLVKALDQCREEGKYVSLLYCKDGEWKALPIYAKEDIKRVEINTILKLSAKLKQEASYFGRAVAVKDIDRIVEEWISGLEVKNEDSSLEL